MQYREGSGRGQGKALAAAKQPDTDTQSTELLTLPESSPGEQHGPLCSTELLPLINRKRVGQKGMRKQCLLPLEA